jgi:hypothetical protein
MLAPDRPAFAAGAAGRARRCLAALQLIDVNLQLSEAAKKLDQHTNTLSWCGRAKEHRFQALKRATFEQNRITRPKFVRDPTTIGIQIAHPASNLLHQRRRHRLRQIAERDQPQNTRQRVDLA